MSEPINIVTRLDRRLEVLAREIAAGPKLKPGFFLQDGKLGYIPPPALIGIDLASGTDTTAVTHRKGDGRKVSRKKVEEATPEFDPMTEPLEIGDLVEIVFPGDIYVFRERGHIIQTRPDGEWGPWVVSVKDIDKGFRYSYRSSLKLIEKASSGDR